MIRTLRLIIGGALLWTSNRILPPGILADSFEIRQPPHGRLPIRSVRVDRQSERLTIEVGEPRGTE